MKNPVEKDAMPLLVLLIRKQLITLSWIEE